MADSDNVAENFRFWAFISYSSKDAAVAKKLHKALETYSIPRDLCGRPGRDGVIPKKLFPIFRDRDELPLASDLGSTIEDALKASRYLIVLCSKRSAQSRWVNEEVRIFKKLGREDRILALIVDGEPSASNTPGQEGEECFPEALRYKVDAAGNITNEPTEPIAGDLRKGGDGWTVAFLKAMAGITGLGYNSFAQREKKRKRVRQVVTGLAAVALLAGGFSYWDYVRVKTHYYEGFVLRRGVPEGYGELTSDSAKKRFMALKIEESRRKVRKVSGVNGEGFPGQLSMVDASYVDGAEFGFPPTVATVEVEYREDGGVAQHRFYDMMGRALMQHVYSQDQKSVEVRSAAGEAAQTMKADFGSVSRRGSGAKVGKQEDTGKTEIARWSVVYDGAGFVVEKSYGNAWGSPTADQDGKATVRYTRDARGHATGESSLGLDGQPVVEVGSQVASLKQEFDARGRLSSISFLDRNGQPVIGPNDYATETLEYDKNGNVIGRIFRDVAGQPVMRKDRFAIFHASYTPDGKCWSKKYMDTADKPVMVPSFGVHEFRYGYDKMGRENEVTCFDEKGQPVVSGEGYHKLVVDLNEKGQATRSRVYGAAGEPILHTQEFWHRQDYVYDATGNLVENSFWGTKDQPILGKDGIHRTTWKFDRQNRCISWNAFGTDGRPCLGSDGVHGGIITYDNRGNISRWAYLGVKLEPVLNTSGHHIYKQLFDEKGSLLEVSYWGREEEPVVDKESRIHRITYTYNSRGQQSEKRTFDVNDQPAYDAEGGYHKVKTEYNKAGLVSRESYYDGEGKPVNLRKEGYQSRTLEYDLQGNILLEEYTNAEGKKCIRADGYHRLVQTFDARGNETSESYYGVRGEPVNRLATMIQRYEWEYDAAGRLVVERYKDASGKSAPMKGLIYHQTRNTYNAEGRVESTTYLDGKGQPVADKEGGYAMVRWTYDERGRKISSSYFDAELKAVQLRDQMYHKAVSSWDALGHETETRYYDVDGNPAECANGFAIYQAEYDARGFLSVRTYFNSQGKPVLNESILAHKITQVCDDRGNVLEESYFDTEGKPTLSQSGIHRVTQTFDALGNELEERYYGISGEPVAVNETHLFKQTYDAFGQVLESLWFGMGDEPVENDKGYHRCIYGYDAAGNVVMTAYFSKDGKPAAEFENAVHCIRRKFDERNQMIEIFYEDGDGKPQLSNQGYAMQKVDYDARGNLSEISYYGTQGEHVLYEGAARKIGRYDQETNELLEVLSYDLDGNLVEQ